MMLYKNTATEAQCPICNYRRAHVLYSVNSEQAAQHFILKEQDLQRFKRIKLHIESLWQQSTCEIVCCEQCEFCYSNPFVAGDKQFYMLAYKRSGYSKWKWEYQLTFETIKEKRLAGFKMLEIGAGDGAFSKRVAEDLTLKENILCTEYSDYGRNILAKFGISCKSEDVGDLENDRWGGYFDVVCMFQVLEHMDNLHDLFGHLNRLTKEIASLFIAVPNPIRTQFNEINGALLDMPPNHIARWNRKCFEIIAERYGWRIKRHEFETTESFIAKAKTFCIYRYHRKKQESRTLANRIEQINNRCLLTLMRVVGVLFYAMTSLLAIIKLTSNQLGASQWVHLRKN